jgi:dTDP-4-amino-4,6-dideoxygalactose transaminase
VTKNSLDSLAVFSGVPAFAESVHVGRPNLGDKTRFLQRIEGILDRRWLTNDGVCVRELEQKIADFTGVRHCIAICNGTIALELATRSLDLSGEVIVPSFTFIATAHSLQWQQIRPVFCDIDPATHNLDPNEIEKLITDKTTAILGVHVWGRPCCIDALERIAAKHDLKLIFDAAHAFGCSSGGKMIGGFGNAEVMSFHATKFFNTLEGGAILTNGPHIARRDGRAAGVNQAELRPVP